MSHHMQFVYELFVCVEFGYSFLLLALFFLVFIVAAADVK